jgi:acetylornithine deacetylase/succinyl-diaminopimelate desuccinylase-like protein
MRQASRITRRAWRVCSAISCLLVLPLTPSGLRAQDVSPEDQLQRAIYKDLVEINSAATDGDVSRASQAVARRLTAGGFAPDDVQVVGPTPKFVNVVATLRGRDRKAPPMLLMAHLDVVPARRAEWKFDPFVLRESEGWFYGRGALDDKAGASVIVANLLRWKRERFVPDRDVIAVFTCDEETTAQDGILWLIAHVPRLKEAEYALNSDGGQVRVVKSGRAVFDIQAAEKVYATWTFTVTNEGGHSSLPRADNAIYTLAGFLTRLAAYNFPVMINEITRAWFTRNADLETGVRADDLRAAGRGETSGPAIERLLGDTDLAARLRTTCVATMLTAGHAENALPQSATATVNCRIMPGVDAADVEKTLRGLAQDPSISVKTVYAPVPSGPSPLRPDLLSTIERLAPEFWKDPIVIPSMETGATDGLFLRNVGVPVYGVGAIAINPEDERSHGLDERVPVRSLYAAREFWYRMVMALTSGAPGSAARSPLPGQLAAPPAHSST